MDLPDAVQDALIPIIQAARELCPSVKQMPPVAHIFGKDKTLQIVTFEIPDAAAGKLVAEKLRELAQKREAHMVVMVMESRCAAVNTREELEAIKLLHSRGHDLKGLGGQEIVVFTAQLPDVTWIGRASLNSRREIGAIIWRHGTVEGPFKFNMVWGK